MPIRTEERVEDLGILAMKFQKMCLKKGLDVYDYVDLLCVSICATATRNNIPKESILEIIELYWATMKRRIEAEKCE